MPQIQGYLAVTLLFHENSDLVRLVVNSIKKDLDDMNEINNCLALHAIANIGGREMAETLATDVHRLLISPYVCFIFEGLLVFLRQELMLIFIL
jgi:vesicle coat complex subunit